MRPMFLLVPLLAGCAMRAPEPLPPEPAPELPPWAAEDFLPRLRSEDCAVREQATRELAALAEAELTQLDSIAATQQDPEVRARLEGVTGEIRWRRAWRTVESLTDLWISYDAESLERISAGHAHPLLVLYRGLELHPCEPIAHAWLKALTGASWSGDDFDSWRLEVASRLEDDLDTLAARSLAGAGYDVDNPDPSTAAAELARALREEDTLFRKLRGEPAPHGRLHLAPLALWLVRSRLRFALHPGNDPAPEQDLADQWIAANRGWITWDGRRFWTRAPRDHYRRLRGSGDPVERAGAARSCE
ncbi:MAG: hypothetical protein HYY18_16310 [Planctomycetes bacterium]|nr:hypothetical protein [Planctomycetota bacterium]